MRYGGFRALPGRNNLRSATTTFHEPRFGRDHVASFIQTGDPVAPNPAQWAVLFAAYAGAALIAPRSRPSAWNRVLRPLTLALWVPLALAAWCVPMAHAAGPLPQGGAFVRGQGAMTSGTTSLTIDQSSSRGVIDWHSFSIGNGNTVAFNNGSGATLNPAPTLFIWIVRTAITYIDCISLAPGAWDLGPQSASGRNRLT
ncbi:hypothetical protein OKW39_006880 [Paraburkholderia sp. MM6662-R1]